MRRALLITMLLTLILSLSSLAIAREPSPTIGVEGTGNYTHEVNRDQLEVWCQTPNYLGSFTSQYDPNPSLFDSESVDDFMSATDAAITSIDWWGATFCPGCTQYFIITFYGDDGTCDGPVGIISQQTIFAFNETDDGLPFYSYSASLVPVLIDAGQKYWVSIIAVMPFTDGSNTQWWWVTGEPVWGCSAMTLSNYFLWLDWTAIFPEIQPEPAFGALAFCLYSDQTVATEASSWGNIKATYK